jgi:hypothetical protein
MRVLVFDPSSNPSVDPPSYKISGARAAAHLQNGLAVQLDARRIQMLPADFIAAKLYIPPEVGFRRSALNEGRCGQFTIGYPIPYAFEGHLRSPRARDVNAVPS